MLFDYLRSPRFNPINMTSENKSVMCFNLSFLFNEAELLKRAMGDFFCWLDEDKLRLPRTTSFRLDQVAEAHAAIESGTTVSTYLRRCEYDNFCSSYAFWYQWVKPLMV